MMKGKLGRDGGAHHWENDFHGISPNFHVRLICQNENDFECTQELTF
jgi:hypothetical protein